MWPVAPLRCQHRPIKAYSQSHSGTVGERRSSRSCGSGALAQRDRADIAPASGIADVDETNMRAVLSRSRALCASALSACWTTLLYISPSSTRRARGTWAGLEERGRTGQLALAHWNGGISKGAGLGAWLVLACLGFRTMTKEEKRWRRNRVIANHPRSKALE